MTGQRCGKIVGRCVPTFLLSWKDEEEDGQFLGLMLKTIKRAGDLFSIFPPLCLGTFFFFSKNEK